MKIIKVIPSGSPLHLLYARATTPARRELLGVMLHTGRIEDMVCGGAFHLLCDIEKSGGLYRIVIDTDRETASEIIQIAEMAYNRQFRKFALSKPQVVKYRRLTEKL